MEKRASEAVRKNLSSLVDALSTESTLREVTIACEQAGLITSGNKRDLLDSSTGQSSQSRASQLVGILQTTVGFKSEYLDTLLCILVNKGGVSGRVVANNISETYGHGLPEYTKLVTAGTDDSTVYSSIVSTTANASRSTVGNSQRGQVNASELLRSHSDRLTTAMSCVLLGVTNNLHAKGLIPLQTKDESLVPGISDYTKASKLMIVLQRQLDARSNPDQYLADICNVFIKQQPLKDISLSILQQLNQHQPSLQVHHPAAVPVQGSSNNHGKGATNSKAQKTTTQKLSDGEIAAIVLRNNMNSIKDAILNLESLADSLLALEILDEKDKRGITDRRSGRTDDERISDLMDIVIATVRNDKTAFDQFIQVLEKEKNRRSTNLAEKLKSAYQDEVCKNQN